jgi:hypothetical protein
VKTLSPCTSNGPYLTHTSDPKIDCHNVSEHTSSSLRIAEGYVHQHQWGCPGSTTSWAPQPQTPRLTPRSHLLFEQLPLVGRVRADQLVVQFVTRHEDGRRMQREGSLTTQICAAKSGAAPAVRRYTTARRGLMTGTYRSHYHSCKHWSAEAGDWGAGASQLASQAKHRLGHGEHPPLRRLLDRAYYGSLRCRATSRRLSGSLTLPPSPGMTGSAGAANGKAALAPFSP